MNNPDSFDRIVSYFHALADEKFDYDGKTYYPYGRLVLTPAVFRSYACPPGCGACCMKCSLVWDRKPPEGAIRKTFTVNGTNRHFWVDEQWDVKTAKCKHLDPKDGRCGIYSYRPFPCQFELFKFAHYRSTDTVYARVAKPGRAWALTKVDGTKGATCTIGHFTKETNNEFIEHFKTLQRWMKKFEIKNQIDKIITYLKMRPQTNSLTIYRRKEKK